jgi:hypothetical protein
MDKGIKLLIRIYRTKFREENRGFYSEEDYREAERKYVIFRLTGESRSQA